MILTGRNIENLFRLLYGYCWAQEAARGIDVSLSTIRRWTAGKCRPPTRARQKITTLITAQIAALEKARDALNDF